MHTTKTLKYTLLAFIVISFCTLIYSRIYWRAALPRYAVATFLSTRVADESEDVYFTATRVLAYQLLHNPDTRTRQGTPFLVLVLPHVSETKRQTLREEGAIVIPIEPVNPRDWNPAPHSERWVDQFSKLQLFGLTDYERILYLDNDMLVTRPLDSIWNEEMVAFPQKTRYELVNTKNQDTNPLVLPKEYILAAVHDTPGPGGEIDLELPRLNAGFIVLKPDNDLLAYYLAVLNYDRRLFEEGFMEQALLNYAHRPWGPMPWAPLPLHKYNIMFPLLADLEAGSATLHDKFWSAQDKEKDYIPRELVEKWWRIQGKMEGYWQRKDELEQSE